MHLRIKIMYNLGFAMINCFKMEN